MPAVEKFPFCGTRSQPVPFATLGKEYITADGRIGRVVAVEGSQLVVNFPCWYDKPVEFLDKIFPVGTRSLLFGAHCWFIHPWFVAAAWIKLYGFPFDPRIWLAFLIHDWGYWGCPNMDGKEGEAHVFFAANVFHNLFDKEVDEVCPNFERCGGGHYIIGGDNLGNYSIPCKGCLALDSRRNKWYNFCRDHSRFIAKKAWSTTLEALLC